MCSSCEWKSAIELADQINDRADDLPDRAREFADSVSDKARDIRESISDMEHVTDRQRDALENMASGMNKWFEQMDMEVIDV